MAKTRRSKRNLRKTRRNQRGGTCKVPSPNNSSRLESSNTCGPGSHVRFSDLTVGLKVKFVGPLNKSSDPNQAIIYPVPLQTMLNSLGKQKPPVSNPDRAAKTQIKEMMRKDRGYIFDVTDVKSEGAFRVVTLKTGSFPEPDGIYNCANPPTNNWHKNNKADYDIQCYGFNIQGPADANLLDDQYPFLRVN